MPRSKPEQRLVFQLVKAASVVELAQRALPELVDAFEAEHVAAFVESPDGSMLGFSPDDMGEYVTQYSDVYAADDPMHRAKQASPHSVKIITRIADRRTVNASLAYQEFYRPRKLEHVLVAQLVKAKDGLPGIGITISRNKRRGDFTEQNLRFLRRVFPLFAATGDRLASGASSLRSLDALSALVDSTDQIGALIVFDADGTAVWQSREAIEKYSGLADVRLPQAARMLCRGSTLLTPELLQFSLLRSGRPIRVDFSLMGGFAVAKLRDEKAPTGVEVFAASKGLTRAETAVLGLLCQGLTNAEIGRKLFVSHATVRTHVDHLRTKLGVSSRLQIALMAQAKRTN